MSLIQQQEIQSRVLLIERPKLYHHCTTGPQHHCTTGPHILTHTQFIRLRLCFWLAGYI